MVAIPKRVFGKTISTIEGKNTRVENGDVVSVVRDLKNKNGKDILVYGGASFVSSLVKENLIDEMYLFINPAIIGKGKPIFTEIKATQKFNLLSSKHFDCGVIVLVYKSIQRSEEHTSELQSLMRISYAVFCLKKKKQLQHILTNSLDYSSHL